MAEKPIPTGPTAAQLALIKKYLAAAGWNEGDLEELFAPETGTPRKTQLTDAEGQAIQDRYQPKTIQAYQSGGLLAQLADLAAGGGGFYSTQADDIIAEYISKGQGLNSTIKNAEGYRKLYDEFVSEQIASKAALNEANLKFTPIEVTKGFPNRDDRYSLFAPDAQGVSRLDEGVVNHFFPSMLANLAAYKAKNPEVMYELSDTELVPRANTSPTTTGIKPADLIKVLQTALKSEPDAGGSVMVNGTRVNPFDVRALLDSLIKSQKPAAVMEVSGLPTDGGASYSVEVAQKNFDEMNLRYGPTSRTPRKEAVEKAADALRIAKQGLLVVNNASKSDLDAKNRAIDAANFAAMKAILDANSAPWVKGAMGGPVTSKPQMRLTQGQGQGQANINPTYQWQRYIAIEEAKKLLEASGRTPYYDALFNMARSGASNLKGK